MKRSRKFTKSLLCYDTWVVYHKGRVLKGKCEVEQYDLREFPQGGEEAG